MTTSHVCHDGYSDSAPVHCEDCDWTGTLADVDPIADIEQRISPGEIVPAGECPECGTLCYISEPDEWTIQAQRNKLAAERDKLLSVIGALLDWNEDMGGGWIAPCWTNAEIAVGRRPEPEPGTPKQED